MLRLGEKTHVNDVHHGAEDALDLVLIELALQLHLLGEAGRRVDDLVRVLLVLVEVILVVQNSKRGQSKVIIHPIEIKTTFGITFHEVQLQTDPCFQRSRALQDH